MKVSRTYSAQVSGLSGVPISVETDVSNGIYSFVIVGLPDQSVGESKERVHSALKNSGVDSPKSRNHKLTVSLAPADIRKEGPIFDLAIAISYLASVGDIENKDNILNESVFIGELSLMGELQPIKGALPITLAIKKAGFKRLFLPIANSEEAALIEDIEIYGANNIKEVIDHIKGEKLIQKTETIKLNNNTNKYPDMGEVVGQQIAKRALEIAAAGGHNICLYGPPGTGKTMLAKAFTGILPELTFDEALEVTSIHSIIGSKEVSENKIITSPPLRAPHHTASYVSIIGGGSIPKPGEITLAHRGVLFLDEFPEYDSKALESLREPLEDCIVRISRARGSETFPAEFILIAAMNPCPCGYAGSKVKECVCKSGEIERYQKKISGPIMDRIDLWVFVQNISYDDLGKANANSQKLSENLKERIIKSRQFALNRYNDKMNIKDNVQGNRKLNRSLTAKELNIIAPLGQEETEILNRMANQLSISPRAYHRIIRVARTIADLEGSENIKKEHILEAFQYRPKLG